MKRMILLLFVVVCAAGQPLTAETLSRPSLSDIRSCVGGCPERGMSMNAVKSRYGEPQQNYPAIGEPPITRWQYDDFTVYFENDRVLHVTEKAVDASRPTK